LHPPIPTRRFGANATSYAWEPIDEALLAYARRLAEGAA
jgi:hypothetical protein